MDSRLLSLLGPDLFCGKAKPVVVARIRNLPVPTADKRSLYAAWLLRIDEPMGMCDLDDVGVIERRDGDAVV